MSAQKFYITTSIPYLNSVPHVGFTMELVQADFLARYNRLANKDVFFLTGADEHGVKIAEVAEKEGITPRELVDRNSAFFVELTKKINSSNDYFVRTTDEKHKKYAQEMWKKLEEAGDIYLDKYSGLYCVGCERFMTLKELVDGNCPNHLKPPIKVEEENYFFKLSKYSDIIRQKIESNELLILPESKKNEILNFMKEGLEDVSFSRPRQSVKWGIEVPGHDDQLMYVWCDALTNYLSAIDREKYWPAEIQVVGKDILRFHAVYWIGMLLSAKMKLPKCIMVHGFIQSEGQKMSKSLGNVKDPFFYIEKYSADVLRYFLLREIPTLDDGDFSDVRFNIVYKDELANTFGNLVSRVLAMNKKYFDGKVPEVKNFDGWDKRAADYFKRYDDFVGTLDLKKAIEEIVSFGFEANKYVEDNKPWELAKNDQDRLAVVIYNLLEIIRNLAILLWPAIPEAAEKILAVFGNEKSREYGKLAGGKELGELAILFPRIEEGK